MSSEQIQIIGAVGRKAFDPMIPGLQRAARSRNPQSIRNRLIFKGNRGIH